MHRNWFYTVDTVLVPVAAVPNDSTPRGLQLHSLYCLTVLSHKFAMGLPD